GIAHGEDVRLNGIAYEVQEYPEEKERIDSRHKRDHLFGQSSACFLPVLEKPDNRKILNGMESRDGHETPLIERYREETKGMHDDIDEEYSQSRHVVLLFRLFELDCLCDKAQNHSHSCQDEAQRHDWCGNVHRNDHI